RSRSARRRKQFGAGFCRAVADRISQSKESRAQDDQPKKQGQHLSSPKSYFCVFRILRVACRCCHNWSHKSSLSRIYFGGAVSFPSNFCIPEKKSTGTGKTTVVFFSTPISVSVCK